MLLFLNAIHGFATDNFLDSLRAAGRGAYRDPRLAQFVF
jgi:hypothetical protein